MNLHSLLAQRVERKGAVRIGIIGAGKFGSMILAQAQRIKGLHVVGVADLDVGKARASLQRVGWPEDKYAAAIEEFARADALWSEQKSRNRKYALQNWSWLLGSLEDYDKALEKMRFAAESDPGNSESHYMLANSLADASQYKDYVLFMLFIKYISDKYGDSDDFAPPVVIPKGASFKDMVALKGNSDIGDKINTQVIQPLIDANQRLARSDFPDFNDSNKLGDGAQKVEKLGNLIAIFENPALDFSKNRAENDDILGDDAARDPGRLADRQMGAADVALHFAIDDHFAFRNQVAHDRQVWTDRGSW